MSEPVELSPQAAIALIGHTDATQETRAEPPPTERQRLWGSMPLLLAFLLTGIGIRATLKLSGLYEEMEIEGGLPIPTQLLVSTAKMVESQPWILTSILFAIAWSFFSFIAGRRARLAWFNYLIIAAILFGGLAAAFFLMLPLYSIMEVIGK